MSGTTYPLNLSEKCWALGLRTPEAIQELADKSKELEKQVAELKDTIEGLDRWQVSAMKDIHRYAKGEDDAKKEIERLKAEADIMYCKMEMMESKVSSFDEMKKECISMRKDNAETDKQLNEIADEIVKADGCAGAYSHPLDLISSWVETKIDGFNEEDYKKMVKQLVQERDHEHTRFLQEQLRRSDVEEITNVMKLELRKYGKWAEFKEECVAVLGFAPDTDEEDSDDE